MKKRIFFVIPSLVGGGAERVTLTVAHEIDREKFSPSIVVMNGKKNDYQHLISDEMPLIDLGTSGRARYTIFALAKCLRRERPDVVVGSLPQVVILLILIKKIFRQRFQMVSWIHNNVAEECKRLSPILAKLVRSGIRHSEALITVSSDLAEAMIEQEGVKRERVTSIYNPVDIDFVREQADKPLDEDHSRMFQNHPIILGVGRLVEQKGYAYLIGAMPLVLEQIPNAQLVILGSGEKEAELKEQASRLGIDAQVHFLGFQKNPFSYIKAADLFVLPSLFEGFALVLVEAMACETPVIATDCPFGPREVLDDGAAGLLVSVKDSAAISNAIVKMLADSQLGSQFVENGRNRIEAFEKKNITRQCEDVFQGMGVTDQEG
jgi:glycosyltransferase involved in cell wall biosynthesis